jgi:hypothetical protein
MTRLRASPILLGQGLPPLELDSFPYRLYLRSMPSIHTTDKGTMRMPSFQAQVSDEEDPLELLFDHNRQDEEETADNCDSEAMTPLSPNSCYSTFRGLFQSAGVSDLQYKT